MFWKWLIVSLLVPMSALIAQGAPGTPGVTVQDQKANSGLVSPIDRQLRALRDKNYDEAYQVTSPEFQAATSFDAFKGFVERHPILTTHREIVIKSTAVHDSSAEVLVELNPTKEATTIKYILTKNDGQWRIWNMSFFQLYSPEVAKLIKDPLSLRVIVENTLQALKGDDVVRVYTSYMSNEFKKTTSLDMFRSFLQQYPLLEQYESAQFQAPNIKDTTGQLQVDLKSKTETTSVLFSLGIEDEEWKIFGVQVLSSTAQPALMEQPPQPFEGNENEEGNHLKFTKIAVGSGSDEKKVVMQPSLILKDPKDNIFIKLTVENGTKETKIEVKLEHLETHSALPPVSTTLEATGSATLSFEFAPAKGWPKGHYMVDAQASTGEKKTFQFMIE